MKMETIVALVSGLVAGFFGGYFSLKKVLQRKYDDRVNAEMQAYINTQKTIQDHAEEMEKQTYDELKQKYHETNRMIKELAEREHPKEKGNSGPCEVILEDGYLNNSNFEKEEAMYYTQDDLLVSMDGEPYDDYESIVGSSFMLHFGEYSDDPDVVYVRNHGLLCDFEIHRVEGSREEDGD